MKHALLCIAIASLIVSLFGHAAVCRAGEAPGQKGPSVPYDPELYGLSYDVFLANSNPAAAYLLSEKAVAARPDDYTWRRRAAQSAEWSGNAAQALENWYFLAHKTREPDAVANAFRLARAMNDSNRLKLLLEQQGLKNNPDLLREYVSVCEIAGAPEDAIAALELHRQGADRKYVLEQLARLYESIGRNNDAIAARLDLVAGFGVNGAELLKAASLAYGAGDIQAAYTILTIGRQLPATEQEFWKTYGDLAWALQDIHTAEKASRLLLESGVAREVDFQRLIMISRTKRPDQAYKLALDAWKRFGKGEYLTNLLEIGISRKRYPDLVALISEAEKIGSLKNMEDAANFWTLVAQVYQGSGNIKASVRSYQKALKLAPADGNLAAGYIWLLLDLDQRADLRRALEIWKGHEKSMPELAEPFGSAYAYLGESRRALRYFQSIYGQKRNDPGWLAAYADTIEQAGWPEAAFVERLRAMYLARKRMKAAGSSALNDRRTLQMDYARLVMSLAHGDHLDKLVKEIIKSPQDETSRQLVAAWALGTQRSDLARIWYWREYVRMSQRPRWVELSLALEENDRPRIARLLEYDLERLPYRDAIEGAQRVGWTPLAETHAFERFQVNPYDYLLDQQIRALYNNHPGWFKYRISLIDQGGIGFMDQQVSLAAPLSNRFSLRLEAGNINIRAQKSDVIGFYPGSIQSAQAGLLITHEGGTTELMAGMRDGFSQYAMLSLQSDLNIDTRRSLNLGLRIGAPATESVALQIAGLKDEADITMLNALTPRDALMLKVSGRSLRDQERRHLGKGVSFEGELTHRLLVGWPDTGLRMFGGYHYYTRTGIPAGNALLLIPASQGTPVDASFYVPESFYQTGVGVSIGQEGRTSYIRDWRPFGAADMIWNSVSGYGYHYEVGLLGPVFGLDNLELAFSQDSGAFGRSDSTTRFDLRYRYHFK